MRRIITALLGLLLLLSLAACGSSAASAPRGGSTSKTVNDVLEERSTDSGPTSSAEAPLAADPQTSASAGKQQADSVDVDLTALSSTMVYSQVYCMLTAPEEYVGKTVKMQGTFYLYTNSDNSAYYPACVIQDATACCAQGLEFLLDGANYPEPQTTITVIGTFETYLENGNLFCHLVNAHLV